MVATGQVQPSSKLVDLLHFLNNFPSFLDVEFCVQCVRHPINMIEWKEHDHEADDLDTMGDKQTIVALLDCGILKLF